MHLPIELKAHRKGLTLRFTDALEQRAAQEPANFHVKTWSLRRTANYGSKHFDERELSVTRAVLSTDSRTVELAIPDIQPTWSMEIRYDLRSSGGEPISHRIHNTIYSLDHPVSRLLE
jgi:hypothetical protein